jgi:ABC-2 type transport system permease protein
MKAIPKTVCALMLCVLACNVGAESLTERVEALEREVQAIIELIAEIKQDLSLQEGEAGKTTDLQNRLPETSASGLPVDIAPDGAVIASASPSGPSVTESAKVYEITGHGEYTFVQLGLLAAIAKENYVVADLDLLTTEQIPEDADTITLLSPEFDLSEDEVEVLRTYLENGGSAMIFTDIAAGELPQLNILLGSFGVNIDFSIVMEGDKARLYDPDNPFFLAPVLQSHQITDPLIEGDLTVLMPYNMPVVELDIVKRNVDIVPLLRSSDKSWVRTQLENTSLLQQVDDLSGPASIAVAINKRKMKTSEPEGFRLVVAGNAGFVGPIPPFGTLKPNVDFLMNSLAWLNRRDDSISVENLRNR